VKSTRHATRQFEMRFVAFVDILGSRDFSERMRRDPELFEVMRSALDTIRKQANRLDKYRRARNRKKPGRRASLLPPADLQMTAFSDCFLISDTDSLWQLFAAVQALGSRLLSHGILTRGAIVRGEAYHRGQVSFGPAMIEAYMIEREVAKYPRILVKDDVRDAIRFENDAFWGGQLLRKDIDGCSFVNVLAPALSKWGPISERKSDIDMEGFLRQARDRLLDMLRKSNTDLRKLSKIRWLAHQFNQVAPQHGIDIVSI